VKTLHVITGLATGGAERALHNLVAGGLAEKFGSAVVSLRDEGVYGPRIRALGVPVHTLDIRLGVPGPRTISKLCSLVREIRPDVIQGWMYHGNLAASLAAGRSSGRQAVVWNIRHSLYDLADEKPLTRQVIRTNRLLSGRADAILYNSWLSREQHETFGFASTRSRVIANGFDTAVLEPTLERRTAARRALGIAEGVPVVGHVARFHPMKDHAAFLRAALAVAERRPDVRFFMIGRDVSLDNPALSGIVPASLADRFICLGERSDVHELMQAMDVFCQSSWSEAFSNVLGEAMASSVPCVATDVGDSTDIVGNTGCIVPPRNSDALAEAMLELLALPDEERAALGRKARERIEANYALPAVVSQYGELYEQLMREKK
jgi:glycosyltransferase involved in cell wall biosynthesis